MNLAIVDWILIGAYLVFTTLIALRYAGQAGKNLGEFFLGGRRLPWYILGISMVATTFAADTPLAVAEIVYQDGISGNWIWWNALIGGMLTTFFFARLWRRANVLTEVEFIALRYTGKASRFLRGFKAIYLGVIMNVMIMGWVNLAFVGILQEFFGIGGVNALLLTGGVMALVSIYSALGGLMGVAVTDVVQFIIAMAGSVILAVIVLNSNEIGGVAGLKEKLGEDNPAWNILPKVQMGNIAGVAGEYVITFMAFLSFVGLQWWASWYPGSEPGGGGYVAQRMMSAKTERDSVWATLFFQVAHYALRPWPWIIVGLCAMVLYPDLGADAKFGYVKAMADFLPDGIRGLCLVAFIAAYMSTISTQLNWGASYLINDLYKPFVKPESEFLDPEQAQKRYVLVSRLATVILMVAALVVTSRLESIKAVWDFIFQCGAGLGAVLILRWFWWRINAMTEIVATATPFAVYMIIQFVLEPSFSDSYAEFWKSNRISYFVTISITTLSWVITAFVTDPEPQKHLTVFLERVRPGGWWGQVYNKAGIKKPRVPTGMLVVSWVSGIVMTYSVLFGVGELIFGTLSSALGLISLSAAMALVLWWTMKKAVPGDSSDILTGK